MEKLSISDIDCNNKKVLIRVDFNVPLDKNANITDNTRILASLPTINFVLDHGGSVILMSHLGRPKGKTKELSLAPCAKEVEKLLGRPVKMAPDCIGTEVDKIISAMHPRDIVLLENLRFYEAEEHPEKDPSFAKKLAALGDLYVNDAFGTAHRQHSSTATITQFFPDSSVAGLLLEKELQFLGVNLLQPKRPFYAIIGGAKISSKLGVIKALIHKVDALFIGGGMAYTFFKAKGYSIGDSIYEVDLIEEAKNILDTLRKSNVKLFLPIDNVIVQSFDNNSPSKIINSDQGIPSGYQGVDIGPKTIDLFNAQLKDAKTVLWNGPLGVFEMSNFAKGTNAIAKTISDLHATTIVGGGDSISAINQAHLADKFTHISTGGGASLEFIEYGTLPGIEALTKSTKEQLGNCKNFK